jgi:serine protease Do
MRTFVLALALGAGLSSAAAAAPIQVGPPTVVEPLPPGASVTLSRVVVRMRHGQEYGVGRYGLVCEEGYPLRWKADGDEENVEVYRPVFFSELNHAGVKAEGDPGDLFEDRARRSSELEVGVAISDVQASYCERVGVIAHRTTTSGKMVFTADWQVFSRVKGEVVARVQTRGGFELTKGAPDGLAQIFNGAFGENVRMLLASDEFRRVVTELAPTSRAQSSKGPIALRSAPAGKRTVAQSANSVVAILAGGGHGSGVLVSDDGYVLTNQHVVGTASYVKIRWSDGRESLGEVVRSDPRRDVALVKTDAGGRKALPLHKGLPAQGDTVFAIGAPIDERLQGTVTRGIVSANRTVEGLSYVQSDVTINGGNSGGPLLNESGAVLALCVSSLVTGEGNTGINLFIPIGEALKALSLTTGA